jgi:non-ribosomal peptide synthetase component E (peptide arylation enzyme)
MTTVNRPGDPEEVLDSYDGRAVPGVEIEARGDNDAPCQAGEPGEAVIRGPHCCLGFVNDPERTRASISDDGWLRTGDLVTIDAAGRVRVVGRRKEIINRGGYKFSPREVEGLLALYPGVDRVAVVRMPDARLGERACAFVVLRAGSSVTLEEIVASLKRENVAPYKWPERLEIVPELPTTASGKVKKFVLEQQLAEQLRGEAQEARQPH